MEPVKRRPGFTIGDNASVAAKRNQEFGTAHKLQHSERVRGGKKSAEKRWGNDQREVAELPPDITEH